MQTRNPTGHARWSLIALAFGFATFTMAHGQSVLISPPVIPQEREPVQRQQNGDTNQLSSSSSGGTVSTAPAAAFENQNPFQWGPIVLHPRVGYGFNYGTGLQAQRGNPRKSVIQTLSPGISFDLGEHWDLSYGAGISFYSDSAFKDNVNHNLTLHGHTTYEDWGFNLSQSVAITSDPLVETGEQTDQQSYSTTFGAGYQINSDWSASVSLSQDIRSSEGLTNSAGSSTDWAVSGSLNYQLGPTIGIGGGAGFGYSKVDVGPDMMYENLNLQGSWQVARKINFSVNGGAQIRQFLDSGQPALLSPTFGASIIYQPLEFTSLSLSASRSISPSFFRNQLTESTSITIGVSQRFFKNYYVSFNGGYSVTTFQDSAPGGTPGIQGREDTRTFFGVNLSRSFLKRGTIALSYSKSENSSNSAGFDYNSDQIGFSVSYSY